MNNEPGDIHELEERDDEDNEDEQEEEDLDDDDDDMHCFNGGCFGIQCNEAYVQEWRSTYSICDSEAIRLGRSLIGNTNLKRLAITMNTDALTANGARAIAGGILSSNLEYVELSGMEAVPPLDLSLLYHGNAQALILRFPVDDNHAKKLGQALTTNEDIHFLGIQIQQFTQRGANALSSGFRDSHIKGLILFGEKSCSKTLKTLYLKGIVGSSIDKLSLQGGLGDVKAVVKVLPALCEFTLDKGGLSLFEMPLLASALGQKSTLKSLRLCDCGLTNEHMRILFPCLGAHKSINFLDLKNNQIGDDGVAAFVEHWSLDSQIQVLDLFNNQIESTGAQRLMTALANRTTECELILSHNTRLGYKGITLIGQALGGKKLSKLFLHKVACWTFFDDETCEDAVTQEAQRHEACQALLEGVWNNVFLKYLNVYSNNLPGHVTDELQLLVAANKNGRHLLLEQHALPPAFWCHLLGRKMTANPSLMFIFLRELPSLMVGQGNGHGRKRRKVN